MCNTQDNHAPKLEPDRSRAGDGPISTRNRTDLDTASKPPQT